jgi:hypothetical protein
MTLYLLLPRGLKALVTEGSVKIAQPDIGR